MIQTRAACNAIGMCDSIQCRLLTLKVHGDHIAHLINESLHIAQHCQYLIARRKQTCGGDDAAAITDRYVMMLTILHAGPHRSASGTYPVCVLRSPGCQHSRGVPPSPSSPHPADQVHRDMRPCGDLHQDYIYCTRAPSLRRFSMLLGTRAAVSNINMACSARMFGYSQNQVAVCEYA